MDPPNLLTPREAAAHARVGRTVVYSWIATGVLPAYRLGLPGKRGKILIAPADLAATLESFRTRPTPAVPAAPSPSGLAPATVPPPPPLKYLRPAPAPPANGRGRRRRAGTPS